MTYPTYPSDGYMFRQLDAEETEIFHQHARDNDPPSGDWQTYHPACREVWYARGLRPAAEA